MQILRWVNVLASVPPMFTSLVLFPVISSSYVSVKYESLVHNKSVSNCWEQTVLSLLGYWYELWEHKVQGQNILFLKEKKMMRDLKFYYEFINSYCSGRCAYLPRRARTLLLPHEFCVEGHIWILFWYSCLKHFRGQKAIMLKRRQSLCSYDESRGIWLKKVLLEGISSHFLGILGIDDGQR